MKIEIVPLNPQYLDMLLDACPLAVAPGDLSRAYFSPQSVSLCLLADGEPVFAGGIVSLGWRRGEAWLLPTKFFRSHVKVCLRSLKECLPRLALEGGFRRVQASCLKGVSSRILMALGFTYEGTLKGFGPSGETCDMFAQLYEVQS